MTQLSNSCESVWRTRGSWNHAVLGWDAGGQVFLWQPPTSSHTLKVSCSWKRSEGDGGEPGVHVAIVTRLPIWKIHCDLGLHKQHNVQYDNECWMLCSLTLFLTKVSSCSNKARYSCSTRGRQQLSNGYNRRTSITFYLHDKQRDLNRYVAILSAWSIL